MKARRLISVISTVLALIVIASIGMAQYSGYSMGTVYQLVNTSDAPVNIDIHYFDSNGAEVVNAQRSYTDVPVGGSEIVVVPKDETNLGTGSYSAVVSSTGTIAGIVNEEFYASTSPTSNPHPPFASYSAADAGSNNVFAPSVMFNYFGYYTEVFIQNVGSSDATDVTITYTPATVNGTVVGATKTDSNLTIKANATLKVSQETMTAIGAPSGSGSFTGRFFGAATVKSTQQPLVVIVNEHNVSQTKLFSTNGFSSGSTKLIAPAAMRGWFQYYTALTIANTSSTASACVHLTYNPDLAQSSFLVLKTGSTFDPVTADFVIPPSNAIIRYEGADSSATQSDLNAKYTRFTGSVTIESVTSGSTCPSATPIVAIQNVEAVAGATSPNQAGAFNAIPVSTATNTLVAPSVLANYYGLYTTMSIANTTSTAATCAVTYTSGGFSTVGGGVAKTYNHDLAANGTLLIYEGNPTSPDARSDINKDPSWKGGGTIGRFLGSATIVCKDKATNTNPVAVVGFVNEESNINAMDSMYTSNMINK